MLDDPDHPIRFRSVRAPARASIQASGRYEENSCPSISTLEDGHGGGRSPGEDGVTHAPAHRSSNRTFPDAAGSPSPARLAVMAALSGQRPPGDSTERYLRSQARSHAKPASPIKTAASRDRQMTTNQRRLRYQRRRVMLSWRARPQGSVSGRPRIWSPASNRRQPPPRNRPAWVRSQDQLLRPAAEPGQHHLLRRSHSQAG